MFPGWWLTLKLKESARRRRAGILARGTRFLRTPVKVTESAEPHPEGVRGFLAPLWGANVDRVFFPGVRKKRVPLATFLAPLRGATDTASFTGFRVIVRGTFARTSSKCHSKMRVRNLSGMLSDYEHRARRSFGNGLGDTSKQSST
jgi:hypothetical protein